MPPSLGVEPVVEVDAITDLRSCPGDETSHELTVFLYWVLNLCTQLTHLLLSEFVLNVVAKRGLGRITDKFDFSLSVIAFLLFGLLVVLLSLFFVFFFLVFLLLAWNFFFQLFFVCLDGFILIILGYFEFNAIDFCVFSRLLFGFFSFELSN